MTDDFREKYQQEVRRLAALRADLKPRRSWGEKIRDLIAREKHPAPKRISGPKLVVDEPERVGGSHPSLGDWSSEAGQAKLYAQTLGPKCANCREPVFAEEATLIGRGLCGRCSAHPPTPASEEGPHAA